MSERALARTTMSISLRSDATSIRAMRQLAAALVGEESAQRRLSTGYRITRASDDAAGLGVATRLEATHRSLGQAVRNATDGRSVLQTAESGLAQEAALMTRVRELAIQAASDGLAGAERAQVDAEAQQLVAELARVGNVTRYAGVSLLDGVAHTFEFHVGVADSGDDVIRYTTPARAASGALAPTTPFQSVYAAAAEAFALSVEAGGTMVDAILAADAASAAAGAVSGAVPGISSSLHLVFEVGSWDAGGDGTDPAPPGPARDAGVALLRAVKAGGPAGDPSLSAAYAAFAASMTADTSFGDTTKAWGAAQAALQQLGAASGSFAANAAEFTFQAAYAEATGAGYPYGKIVPPGPAFDAALAALGRTGGAGRAPPWLDLSGLSLATRDSAVAALSQIDGALPAVSNARADLGAVGNRLESAISNGGAAAVATQAARGRVVDADVAEESSASARNGILAQSAAAVLAQANQRSALALRLLEGA